MNKIIEWHPVQYAGRWHLQYGPTYEDKNVLDAEAVGEAQAELNARKAADTPVLRVLSRQQKAYIRLLSEELDEVLKYVPKGWRSSRFEKGKDFREVIEILTDKLSIGL